MSVIRIITMCTVALLSFGSQAFESAVTPHAMIYVSIPFGGNTPERDSLNYGFRLDSIAYTSGEHVDYQRQLQKTAVLDLRMNEHGVDGLYLSGIDYLKLYRANRQNEQEGDELAAEGDVQEQPAAEESAEAAVTEETEVEDEEEDDGLTVGDHIRGVFADMRRTAPMGIWMGAALGIGLLIGVDD